MIWVAFLCACIVVVSFSTYGAQIAHHLYLKLLGYSMKMKQGACPLSLLYHPGVCDCHFSIHFFQHPINVPVTQGQANERFLVTEAGLTDDRKAAGGVSWQGMLQRRGTVACWEVEPRQGTGSCGQGHGYSAGGGEDVLLGLLLLACLGAEQDMLATSFLPIS